MLWFPLRLESLAGGGKPSSTIVSTIPMIKSGGRPATRRREPSGPRSVRSPRQSRMGNPSKGSVRG